MCGWRYGIIVILGISMNYYLENNVIMFDKLKMWILSDLEILFL